MAHESAFEESKMLQQQRRFLDDIEQGIRAANREVIHEAIPTLDRDAFLALAVSVARLRAAYLARAMVLTQPHHHIDAKDVADLRAKREAFDEARLAFEAATRAIERGYISMKL